MDTTPNLSARRTAMITAKTAQIIVMSVPLPPLLVLEEFLSSPLFVVAAFFAARDFAAPSFDQGFNFPLKSSTDVYPFDFIISLSSEQIRSKHFGPSVQWHVPTCTADAPHSIISKASLPLCIPPTPTTSIDSSNNSLIFFTFANAVYFTAGPDKPANPPLLDITGISATVSTANALPIVLILATYRTISLYLLRTSAAFSKCGPSK
mmetsp:Transcript_2054/g.3281  ORF Transcript_2054/g.3281 Transcript_2054/m.3281 type:complete len:207 (-) Transcript_2054:715-1335(-)